MNKTIFQKSAALLATLMLALSCSQDVEFAGTGDSLDTREPITFSVNATRGAIVSDLTEFSIYAVDDETGDVVIDHAKFTLKGTVWISSESFYWTNNTITFYAYTPSVTTSTNISKDVVTYAMSTDVAEQPDLMVATANAKSGSVSLQFSRIMAIIKFSVSGESDYALTDVSVTNIIDGGEFSISNNEWTPNSTLTDEDYSCGIISGVVDGGTGTSITDTDGYLMVMPQISNAIITVTNSNGTPATYKLTDVTWSAGTLYNYTIGIDGIEPEIVIPDNPNQNPSAGLFDLDEYDGYEGSTRSSSFVAENIYTGNTILADLESAIDSGITTFVFTGEYDFYDNVFGYYTVFADISGSGYTVDFSAVTGWSTNVGYGLVILPNEFLWGAAPISKVILPDAVQLCDQKGFYNCTNLTSVNMDNLQYLGLYTFYNCTSLTELDLPMLNHTGNGSLFSGCTNLTTLKMTYSGDMSEIGEGTTSTTDPFYNLTTTACTLYLHINQKDDVTLGADGTYVGAIWKLKTWKEIIFVNDDGEVEDPLAEKIAYICFDDYNDLSVAYYSNLASDGITSMYEQIQIYDEAGYTYYKVCCTPTKSTGNRSFPFVDFDTENVTLDLSEVTGFGNTNTGYIAYYWDSNYFCHQAYTGNATQSSVNLSNITKLITPTDVADFTQYSIYGMKQLKEVIVTAPVMGGIGSSTFYNCPALEAVSIVGFCNNPSSWVNSTAFGGTTDTSKITLTLGSNQSGYVSGNTWASKTWKEIILE